MISLLLAVIMVFALAACGQSAEPAAEPAAQTNEAASDTAAVSETANNTEPQYAEWLYNGRVGDLDTADPYGGTSSQTEWLTNMTFDTVVYNNPETGEIDPELAYKWEGNEDNTEWTFYLEEGVTFHNGDKLTAEDVKFTYEYAANLDGATNVVKTFTAGTYAESVEVIDDYTIKFILKQPMPDFPAYMEMKVYSKNAIETLGHAEGSVIGTGPYYFDKDLTVSGQVFVATRNDNYWRGTDEYKTLHQACKIYGDKTSMAAALQAGEIDFSVNLLESDYNTINADPNLTAELKTGCASYYMGFNYGSKNADMNDVEIRRAICQCIDKDSIVAIAWEGLAEKSINFCAPSGLGYSANIKGLDYNPEAGAATLQAKGVKNLTLVYYAGATATAAEVIQACLAQAGVEVTLRLIDGTNWTTFKAAQDGYDLFLDYASYRGALLYNFNRFLYRGGSSNVFGFASDEYEALQDKVSAQTNWEDMVSVFGELQQWVADNAPLFPLVYNYMFLGKANNVEGGYLGGSDNACDWATAYKIVG